MNLRTAQISYQVMYSSRNSPCKRMNEDEPTTLKKKKRKRKNTRDFLNVVHTRWRDRVVRRIVIKGAENTVKRFFDFFGQKGNG